MAVAKQPPRPKKNGIARVADLWRSIRTFQPAELLMTVKIAADQRRPAFIPPVNADFFAIADLLNPEERAIQAQLRGFMEREVRPIVGPYWERGEFPHQLVPSFANLVNQTFGSKPFSLDAMSPTMTGIACMELARVDPSIYTFFGVHWGLAMGSIELFGSEEQKRRWLPIMQRFEKIGSWALTEPEVGSATAVHMQTSARREGDTWILNGAKKWSGNAPIADLNVVFARDIATGKIVAFLVQKGTPGYHVEKLGGKIALRIVQNADIRLENVRLSEADRLPGVRSFRDVARQLAITRAVVAWAMTGTAMGAYEHALTYATRRMQFGRPIASFQLIQNQLVQMLANVTAMQTLCLRMGQLHERDGEVLQERASLAKVFCGERMRETVSMARAVFGGNGILLEHEVGRFFADAEALYSYEGTHEMNTLIVGRAITGISAFI